MKRVIAIVICSILCITVLSGCATLDPAEINERVYVSSGKNTIETKRFFSWSIKDGLASDSWEYENIYQYSEEELAALPTLTLAGEITANLSEDATTTEILDVRIINVEKHSEDFSSFEALSSLEKGKYYVRVRTSSTFKKEYSRGYDHIFCLIVE